MRTNMFPVLTIIACIAITGCAKRISTKENIAPPKIAIQQLKQDAGQPCNCSDAYVSMRELYYNFKIDSEQGFLKHIYNLMRDKNESLSLTLSIDIKDRSRKKIYDTDTLLFSYSGQNDHDIERAHSQNQLIIPRNLVLNKHDDIDLNFKWIHLRNVDAKKINDMISSGGDILAEFVPGVGMVKSASQHVVKFFAETASLSNKDSMKRGVTAESLLAKNNLFIVMIERSKTAEFSKLWDEKRIPLTPTDFERLSQKDRDLLPQYALFKFVVSDSLYSINGNEYDSNGLVKIKPSNTKIWSSLVEPHVDKLKNTKSYDEVCKQLKAVLDTTNLTQKDKTTFLVAAFLAADVDLYLNMKKIDSTCLTANDFASREINLDNCDSPRCKYCVDFSQYLSSSDPIYNIKGNFNISKSTQIIVSDFISGKAPAKLKEKGLAKDVEQMMFSGRSTSITPVDGHKNCYFNMEMSYDGSKYFETGVKLYISKDSDGSYFVKKIRIKGPYL